MANSGENEDIIFIQEIEKYPCLYDESLQATKEANKKAWAEIGEVMLMTGSACSEKWRNILPRIRRYFHRQGQATSTSKPFYLANYVAFMEPHIKGNMGLAEIQIPQIETVVAPPEKTLKEELTDTTQVFTEEPITHSETIDETPETSIKEEYSNELLVTEPPNLQSKTDNQLKQKQNIPECQDEHSATQESNDDNCPNYQHPKRKKMSSKKLRDVKQNPTVNSLLNQISFELKVMDNEQFKIFKRKVLTIIDDVMST